MEIYKSNFANLVRVKNPLSIARYSPHWYKGKKYKPLMPYSWIIQSFKSGKISEEEYEMEYYNTNLSKLNPKKVVEDIKNKTILCWCKAGDFCHRNIASDWIEKETGIIIKEHQFPYSRALPDKQETIF